MIAKCKYKYEVNHTSNLFLIVKISSSILQEIYLCSKEIRVKINKAYLGRFYNCVYSIFTVTYK